MKNRSREPVTTQLVRNLFLIDGFGALVSAILLGTVLVEFQPHFGIPISTLYFLAALPVVFAVYDFYCYFVIKNELGAALKRIAFANLGYCCLSLGMAIYHSEFLTTLGWLYILIEILIVSGLAVVELKSVKNMKQTTN